MATLTSTVATLADLNSRMAPGGGISDVIEVLAQNNEILDDMLWVEGNLPTGYKTTIRTGYPAAAWRLLNYGVPYGKSLTAQITDTCAMLEIYSKIDKSLLSLSKDQAAFRASEDVAFIESLSETMATSLIYGNNASNPAQFTGLSPRFGAISGATNGVNVINGGGTGSTNTSIWVVAWGYKSVHGIYPQGSVAGLQYMDVTTPAPVFDSNGNPYQAVQTHYKWDCGLTVRDWTYIVRIPNIDVTLLTKNAASGADLNDLLGQAMYKIKSLPRPAMSIQRQANARGGTPLAMTKPAIYCNRTVKSFLDRQAQNKTNVLLQNDQWDGYALTNYRGVPIHVVDAIVNTESRVV